MQCVIKKLEINNFMSFADDVIDFSAKPGITSILGVNNDIPGAANGAGKSSGPIALFYCLYGKSAIKTKNKFLKNKYVNDNTGFSVTLTLNIDGVEFKIHRGADSNGNSFLRLFKKYDDEIVDITPASIYDCEKLIVNTLNGMNADIFLKTVFLTPAYGANFFTLSNTAKNEFLNLISGTDKLYNINSQITKDISEINTNIKILDSELMTLSKNNSILIEKKANYLKQQEENAAAYSEKAAKFETDIIEYKKQITELNSIINDSKQKITTEKTKNNKIANTIQNINLNISKLNLAKRNIATKDKHIDEFINKNKTICDIVCADCLPKVKDMLNITEMLSTKTSNNELNKQLDAALCQCNNDLTVNIDAANNLTNIITNLTNQYTDTVDNKNKIERLLDATMCNLQLLKDRHNEVSQDVFSSMIETNNKSIADKQLEKTDIIKQRQKLSILQFATDSDTVRKFVTSRFVADINHYISKYLSDMGVNYYCKFENDFTYTFLTPAGEMSYDNFSSGEKMRLNIAMSFALRKLLMTYLNLDVNVLILDEYLDSNLDALAITGITTVLTEIKQNPFYNIFLISHRKEFLSGSIDNIMTVTKTNGISEISYSAAV